MGKNKKSAKRSSGGGVGVHGSRKNPLITRDNVAAQIKKARQSFQFFKRGLEQNMLEPDGLKNLWVELGGLLGFDSVIASAESQVAAVFDAATKGNLRLKEIAQDDGTRVYDVSTVPPPWTPLQEVPLPKEYLEQMPGAEGDRIFMNSRYQVVVRENAPLKDKSTQQDLGPPMVHLSIKRLDKAPVRCWRDVQRIKNELVGEEAEGAELYPAEDRLIDTANQYHLYCLRPPHRLPFGTFTPRMVSEEAIGDARQEPWEEGSKPADLISAEEVLARTQAPQPTAPQAREVTSAEIVEPPIGILESEARAPMTPEEIEEAKDKISEISMSKEDRGAIVTGDVPITDRLPSSVEESKQSGPITDDQVEASKVTPDDA